VNALFCFGQIVFYDNKVKDKKWVITLQTVMGNYLENITSKMSNYHEKRHIQPRRYSVSFFVTVFHNYPV